MKKKIKFAFAIILTLTVFPLIAQKNKEVKISELEDGAVVLYGKIKIIYDGNISFYADTFNLKEAERNNPYSYKIPVLLQANRHNKSEKLPDIIENGNYFYDYGWVVRNKIKYNSLLVLLLFTKPGVTKNTDSLLTAWLPFDFECSVPKKEKYIYVGTIVYYVSGSDFQVDKVEIVDDYEQAKIDFSKAQGEDKKLCRALLEIKKE